MGHHLEDDGHGERVFVSDKFLIVKRSDVQTHEVTGPHGSGKEKIYTASEHAVEHDHLAINLTKAHCVPAAVQIAQAYAGRDTELAEDIIERLWELHPALMEATYGGDKDLPDPVKSTHQLRVERCMRGWGQEVPTRIMMATKEVRLARARLLAEELFETIRDGLGIQILLSHKTSPGLPIEFRDLEFDAETDNGLRPNVVEVADGCADLSVVLTGTLSAFGIPDKALLALVDQNNLEKTENGHLDEATGKFMKPPGHQPPDIAGLLGLK